MDDNYGTAYCSLPMSCQGESHRVPMPMETYPFLGKTIAISYDDSKGTHKVTDCARMKAPWRCVPTRFREIVIITHWTDSQGGR